MNVNLLAALKVKIMSDGEDVLDDVALMGQTLAEQCAEEPKPEVLALMLCLAADYHKVLRVADEAEREAVKQSLALRLHGAENMDLVLCNSTLDLLCAALFGEGAVPETPAENETLKIRDAEIRRLKETVRKIKSGLWAAIIIGITASIGIGVFKSDNRKDLYNGQSPELTSAQTELTAVQTELTAVRTELAAVETELTAVQTELAAVETELTVVKTEKSAVERLVNSFERRWSINVTSIQIGNKNTNTWITQPGQTLYARDMWFLTPVITYNSLVSGEITFDVRIISPRIKAVYKYADRQFVTRGSNQKASLTDSWKIGSVYTTGEWTVEVWYEDVCLRSEKVKLN